MKVSNIKYGILALVAASLAQSASASVVAGFYSFSNSKPIVDPGTGVSLERAETWMPGITAWLESPQQAPQANGGSYDTTYGPGPSTTDPLVVLGNLGAPQVNKPPGDPASYNDGAATVRNVGQDKSRATFYFKNETGFDLPLAGLCFDIADIAESGVPTDKLRYTLAWIINGVPGATPLVDSKLIIATTAENDYTDEMVRLHGYTLPNNSTVGFQFSMEIDPQSPYTADTVWIDNIALLAIPEPGSVLGLGCVLASGLLLRNRRKI